MKMSFLAVLTIIVVVAVSVESSPEWDDLRVTWGLNPFTSFNKQPRTLAEAEKAGFKRVGPKECDGTGVYNGFAYVKDNDYALTLLYDKNGIIAGIQHGLTAQIIHEKHYPSKKLQPPFVYVNGRLVLTAYFTDPSKICTVGRTKEEFESQGTGTHLWVQIGSTPKNVVRMPKKQSDLAGTNWTEGKCFVTMGKHYWYSVKPDMDCDTFLPVFLLYNKGELNAFGWVMLADLPSGHYEHPDVSVVSRFMDDVPKCVHDLKHKLSTMHVYLTSTPLLDLC